MNTHVPNKITYSVLTASLLIIIVSGFLFLNNFEISIQPKSQPSRGCSLDAKMCPDGSTVGRVSPTCEFAPCPTVTNLVTETPTVNNVDVASIVPMNPAEVNSMAKIADLPLIQIPNDPQSVKFVIEHRSAFNEKKINVTGVVVQNNTFSPTCAPGSPCPMMNSNAQPNIIIADSDLPTRDTLYDLRINFPDETSEANTFTPGQKITLYGTVTGSSIGVVMMYEK